MKFCKKWFYMVLLLATGFLYLNYVDDWQVYAEPLRRIEGFFSKSAENEDEGQNSEAPQNSEAVAETSQKDSAVEEQEGIEADKDVEQMAESVSEQSGGETSETHPGEAVYHAVEDDYFADAVFIGDSRTVGMYEYGELEDISTFYASTGLTVYKLLDAPIAEVAGKKEKITVEEALTQNSFAKIYLMIGINEMGTGTVEGFAEKYREVLTRLQELQPEAVIYIQGIMKVTKERSEQGDYIHNEGIEQRNEEIKRLADNEKIFYLDVNPLICDETGGMAESYTYDGVHLKAKYIQIWKDYLKAHAV